MSLLNNFPHRCTIRRLVRVKGTLGGSKDSPLNEQTSILCWAQNATQKEVADFEKRGMFLSRKIYFLVDPGVTERHQILVTEMNGTTIDNPIVLKVRTEAMPDASAGKGVVYKVFCSETTGEDT